MVLRPGCLPALQTGLRLTVSSACEEPEWLLELNLAVRLHLSDVSTAQPGLEILEVRGEDYGELTVLLVQSSPSQA